MDYIYKEDTYKIIGAAQVMHYLKATKLKLGLIINFGEPGLKVKRIIL